MRRWAPRAVLVPVLWYLAGTLLLPLLNGAGARWGFWSHAAVVAAATGVLGLAACALHAMTAVGGPGRRRTAHRHDDG
jgi:hypothetical protein